MLDITKLERVPADERTLRIFTRAHTPGGGGLQSAIRTARSLTRFRFARTARAKRAAAAALHAFGQNADVKGTMRTVIRTIGSMGIPLTRMPAPLMLSRFMIRSSYGKARKLLGWFKHKLYRGSLSRTVNDWWKAHQKTILSSTSKPIKFRDAEGNFTDAETPVSRCLLAGTCLCSDAGKQLFAFRNRYLQTEKVAFPVNTPDRKGLLATGYIFVNMRGSLAGAPGAGGVCHAGPMPPAVVDEWFGIGMHHLSPFQPTFGKYDIVPGSVEPGNLPRLFVKVFVLRGCYPNRMFGNV